ncbi:diguanylate cyclase [Desulfuromonas sp. AOP6]|uniref:diguanylate cyclase n=1 Tax=Desulfuromonas sp. AOP6 TaxID=1566351 RepID=UPI0012890C10|nr:diguanylate cyclase [Desulfuromonas sp. AOP6]BCA79183.1 GGDEF domain-containing protein [Desulfuromonas sp. AOP6]
MTVTKRVAAGYLLVVIFTLTAIIYALASLHTQTTRSEKLVSVDFNALNLSRNLRQNLLTQDRLEKQLLILKDVEIQALLNFRQEEADALWKDLAALPLEIDFVAISEVMANYQEERLRGNGYLKAQAWQEAERFSRQTLAPLRSSIIDQFDALIEQQENTIDNSLVAFSADSSRAYQVAVILTFMGLFLSGPVALTVILSIHRSIKKLVQATHAIAAGSFDHQPDIHAKDEFGDLAREFAAMAVKLRELEQVRLDANPLTHLPGGLSIERELEARVRMGKSFAHLYLDLDHFKPFGDRYGYKTGSDVIAFVGDVINDTVRQEGTPEDLVGHIGGDDYVVITEPELAEPIAKKVIERFDREVPRFYTEEDRRNGFFFGKDRFGIERQFPILTLSIAIICSNNLESPSSLAISRECANIKDHLKKMPGSNYLINRRRNL